MPRQYPDPLRRFCRFLTRPFRQGSALKRRIIPRDEHDISRQDFSRAALHVLYGLKDVGFEAYLVGGCLRDILTGIKPKDFDVVTNAHPEEIERVFRGARIIGRRFRLVHVRFKGEVIEVATFRALAGQDDDADNRHSRRNADGRILRDNVYGTIEEDAIRRDFTVNALYYTTENFAVHDYTNGIEDLQQRLIRIIGDPETRYREDPVRMLRAVRFAAKLGFTIEPGTGAPIPRLANMLVDVPSARMFDEILKLLMAGHGEATYRLMQQYGLFEPLFPATAAAIDDGLPLADALISHALRNTDERIAADKPVTPAFLFAALLWPALQQAMTQLTSQGVPEQPALQQAAQMVIDQQQRHTAIPRRFSQPMREIWEIQWRLPRRDPRRVVNLMENPRLRAGYDFLLLREQAGEEMGGLGYWWTEFLNADDDHRQHLLRQVNQRDNGGRRRRRRKS